MKKVGLVSALIAFGGLSQHVMADDDAWLVRFRAVNIAPANKSDPIGGSGASDRLSVQSKTIPEVDFSYFFTPNIAAEVILTYPQKHNVSLDGGNIGTFKELPPTVTAQYHFTPTNSFDPYVGLGVNYTNITDVNLLNGSAGLDHNSFGVAFQAGVDYKIDKKWSVNLDIKKIKLGSDVTVSGEHVSHVNVDPLLIALGVGYRF